jgi:hypothetical protein
VKNLQDAFRVYLKEPLQHLPENKPMLVVIDGLDECESDQRIELLNVLANEFSKLPPWVKVLVTSRPEMNVLEKLNSLEYMEIATDKNNEEDTNNEEDIKLYLRSHLPTISERKGIISFITKFCEGSFLFASYLQKHLHNCKAKITKTEIKSQLPQGISSVYQDYFARLQEELKAVSKDYDILDLLNIMAAARGSIPLSFITENTEISVNRKTMIDIIAKVNENISTLLFVNNNNGLVTVFHKSVFDWLKLTGNEEHKFSVTGERGDELLWTISKKRFEEIKKTILGQTDRSIIAELKKNEAMKFAIQKGFNHLPLPQAPRSWSKIEDYEWLVDVVILYLVLSDPLGSQKFRDHWKDFVGIETADNISMMKIKEKISWYCRRFVLPLHICVCVQDIFNDSSEMFSDEEKHIAKHILHYYARVWFEKLNSTLSPHSTPNINVTACAFSPEDEHLVICAADGKIQIWNVVQEVPSNSVRRMVKFRFDVVQEVSSNCKHAICCFWTNEISIFHNVGSDLVLLKYPVNQDSNVEVNKMTKKTFETDKITPLAFSPKAFIYRCVDDSKIKVHYFARNIEISIPELLHTMEKFAVSRDGLYIIAARKDKFQIWKIDGNTLRKCHLAKTYSLLEKVVNGHGVSITTFRCSIPSDENYGIISCLCSKVDPPKDHPSKDDLELCVFSKNTESGKTILCHPTFSSFDIMPADCYPREVIPAVNKIDDSFLCQSGKRISVYGETSRVGWQGALTRFKHEGYLDYYKKGSICRNRNNVIALPQKSGGILLVQLHLTNFDSFNTFFEITSAVIKITNM